MNQDLIDDISDMLQMRNSEHRKYPYGHPRYRPTEGAPLPYIPGLGSRISIDFATNAEAESFYRVFSELGSSARSRAIEHFKEIGRIEHGI